MNVTFYGKRDFTGMTKLRILRWDDYVGQFGVGLKCNHKSPFKREVEGGLTTVEEKAI